MTIDSAPPLLPAPFPNPFKPGAGHMPPYLAGRKTEEHEFRVLLRQNVILTNLVLTGLRGVGKTVLLESFRPIALQEGWLWAGTDLSESVSVNEAQVAARILADVATATSTLVLSEETRFASGFGSRSTKVQMTLNYATLMSIYDAIPGLVSDKLKGVLQTVWTFLKKDNRKGLIFAYDEAQNLSDNAAKDQYPLSLLLDVFQSIQRKNIPFMLVLTGLPPLVPKLVETRTYTERMFHVVFLRQLSKDASREAIQKPIEDAKCPVNFDARAVESICSKSGGYPYFIQFICREAFDDYLNDPDPTTRSWLKMDRIEAKLDADFFHGRWSRATDRQRELLEVIALLPSAGGEFSVQEIVASSRDALANPFGASQVNQMLTSLTKVGLIYKNRHGRYSFAVPLLHEFIQRQMGPVASYDDADVYEEELAEEELSEPPSADDELIDDEPEPDEEVLAEEEPEDEEP
jgi:hypothetical protein